MLVEHVSGRVSPSYVLVYVLLDFSGSGRVYILDTGCYIIIITKLLYTDYSLPL